MLNKLTKEQVEFLREEIAGGTGLSLSDVKDVNIEIFIEDMYDNDLEELLEDMLEGLVA